MPHRTGMHGWSRNAQSILITIWAIQYWPLSCHWTSTMQPLLLTPPPLLSPFPHLSPLPSLLLLPLCRHPLMGSHGSFANPQHRRLSHITHGPPTASFLSIWTILRNQICPMNNPLQYAPADVHVAPRYSLVLRGPIYPSLIFADTCPVVTAPSVSPSILDPHPFTPHCGCHQE